MTREQAVTIQVSPTYLPSGLESGQYAVILDIGNLRWHYQPKDMVSYSRETAVKFAADLSHLFDGAIDPLKIVNSSSYFVRVA